MAVGVCVPVHNEENRLSFALEALSLAFRKLPRAEVVTSLAIVLDDCSDRSEAIARNFARHGSHVATKVLTSSARSVGAARQMGCLSLMRTFGSFDLSRIWLATTDADSEVPPDWLVHQLDCRQRNVAFWAGRVSVADWSDRAEQTAQLWRDAYFDESAPVHGANIGIDARLFQQVGGFPPLPTGEDKALERAVLRAGAPICHDWRASVKTSARVRGRAPLGFAHYLDSLETCDIRRAPV